MIVNEPLHCAFDRQIKKKTEKETKKCTVLKCKFILIGHLVHSK